MKTILSTLASFIILFNLALGQGQELWCATVAGGLDVGGTIIHINSESAEMEVAYLFDWTDGATPMGTLMQASDGLIYGSCYNGGAFGSCVLYSYDPSTDTYVNEYDFDIVNGDYPTSGLVEASNGKLYGAATSGHLYSFDPSSSLYSVEHIFSVEDGVYPNGKPIFASNGKLYGATIFGGETYGGVLYSYDIETGNFNLEYEFTLLDGREPNGSLIELDNFKLYGMTRIGGEYDAGAIFSFDLTSGNYEVIYSFNPSDSFWPIGDLFLANNGLLYGMTTYGGANNLGVIFSFDPGNNSYTEMFDFNEESGGNPNGNLIQGENGKLYGATPHHGALGNSDYGGTIFSFDISNNTFNKLADFGGYDSPDGSSPNGGFIILAEAESVSENTTQEISVYPNPAKDKLSILFPSASGKTEINILNVTGDVVYTQEVGTVLNRKIVEVNTQALSLGVYIVEVESGGEKVVRKIVKD